MSEDNTQQPTLVENKKGNDYYTTLFSNIKQQHLLELSDSRTRNSIVEMFLYFSGIKDAGPYSLQLSEDMEGNYVLTISSVLFDQNLLTLSMA